MREVPALRIDETGVAGNRDLFLIDDRKTLFSVTRTGRLMRYWSRFDPESNLLQVAHGTTTLFREEIESGNPVRAHFFGDRYVHGHLVQGGVNCFMSDLVEKSVRLVRVAAPGDGYDVHPVTMVSEASVCAIGNEMDGSPLNPRRFRLNIVMDGVDEFAEDEWQGHEVDVGDACLRLNGPVPRCVSVSRTIGSGSTDVNVLRLIKQARGVGVSELGGKSLNLGIYATVVQPGVVTVGDRVIPV